MDYGGPNNIIYKILKSLDYTKIQSRYLSKNIDCWIDSPFSYLLSNNFHPLYFQSNLYRKLVSTPFYLRYHYYKGLHYFNKKNKKIENDVIIHSHDVLSFYNFRNRKQKKILTIHSKGSFVADFQDYNSNSLILGPLLSKFKEIEKEAVRNADLITFPSCAAKDLFFQEMPNINSSKVKIIYNSVDIESIRKIDMGSKLLPEKKANEIFLLNIADHLKVKNIDEILYTVEILKNNYKKEVKLINAGIGPETNNLIHLARELNIYENVIFLGNISNTEIIKLMKNCDFFIMLSRRVIFDLVVLEAMACGMTIIASNNGGNKEIIKNEENGYLLENTIPHKVAERIINADKKCGVIARKNVLNFSMQKMVDDYYNLYLN